MSRVDAAGIGIEYEVTFVTVDVTVAMRALTPRRVDWAGCFG